MKILARELTEPDVPPVLEKSKTPTVEEVCRQADHNGVGEPFRELLKAATETGLFPRPYRRSIMYTPPFNRNRMLFTVWVKGVQGRLRAYVSPKAFSEFYPRTEEEAREALGEEGWHTMERGDVQGFVKGLRDLLLKE